LEHIAAEINMAVAQGITVVAGTGNGDYGFPGAMKQVIAVGGVHIDPADTTSLAVWDGGSAFRCKITAGDCANRFVPDVCGLAGQRSWCLHRPAGAARVRASSTTFP
jgi:hypothetical protein